jgi:hypothetical protein
MPVSQCKNGKWKIGSGECIYETKEKAIEVWQAILATGQYGKTNNIKQSNLRETEGRQSSQEQEQAQS